MNPGSPTKENENSSNNLSYCVSVDGSKHSDFAIELVLTDFFKKGDRLNVVHVLNNDFERMTPYDYEVHKVLDHYINKNGRSIAKKDYKSHCLERNPKTKHSLQQTFVVSIEQRSDMLFVGFKGDKTSEITTSNFPKSYSALSNSTKQNISSISKNNKLSNGILYILELPKLPLTTCIVKEVSHRNNKDNKGFTWCFCIKDLNSSYQLFKNMLTFVNKELDVIKGIHIKTESGKYDKELEKQFKKHCQENGVKHFTFKYLDRSKSFSDSIGLQISNLVNFGEDYIDFVICHYDNASYYYIENHPLYDLIMNVESNVIFSQIDCPNKILFKYTAEEDPDLDNKLVKLTLGTLGLNNEYADDKEVKVLLDDLKVDRKTIKKKDLLSYIDKMRKGEKTFVDKSILKDDFLLIENTVDVVVTETDEQFLKRETEQDIINKL